MRVQRIDPDDGPPTHVLIRTAHGQQWHELPVAEDVRQGLIDGSAAAIALRWDDDHDR